MADNPRIEELKRRVHSDPASIAFAALAEEYRRAGLFEEAIATCKAGLQRHPAYLSAHVTLGRALIEVNRFDEAREELEYVLKIAPENLAAIRALAEIHHRRGEGAEEDHYKEAIATAHAEPHPAPPASPPPGAAAPAKAPVQPAPAKPPAAAAPAKPPAQAVPVKPAVQPLPAKPPVQAVPVKPPVQPLPVKPPVQAVPVKPAVQAVPVKPSVAAAAPAPDPALAELEAFLAAIVRAREELESAPSNRG